jgi:hypothetical protein
MKKLSLIVLIILSVQFSFAKTIDVQTAQLVGTGYYYEHVSAFKPIQTKDLSIKSTEFIVKDNIPLYYIINFNTKGFIIVTADDQLSPVIGYSYESNFSNDSLPQNLRYWMKGMEGAIKYWNNHKIDANTAVAAEWNYYLNTDFSSLQIKKDKAVAPLLRSSWDQGKYYNYYCPEADGGPDDKALVGCVAVSMAQVMYYYRYPATGQGSHNGINFGSTTYEWDNMMDDLSGYNTSTAKLLYHVGESVDMNYGADGSGAYTPDCVDALVYNFKYSSACEYSYKGSSSLTTWKNLLKSNIDALHPLIYSGHDPNVGSGHAWNCDGYDASDNFHMNWGWSGYGNGYFAVNNLSVSSYTFSDNNGIVGNIYPPSSAYPNHCTGSKSISYTSGTIVDGSGIQNCQNNNDCQWLIAPSENVTKIKINFDEFDTELNNDIVTLYDGNSVSAPVLGTYSGNAIPAVIYSTGKQVLVRFQTNSSISSKGWQLTYSSVMPVYCVGVVNLTAPSGTFEDGSTVYDYGYHQMCRWTIAPPNATSISLTFNDFNVAPGDTLRISNLQNGTVYAKYSGTTIPPVQTYNAVELYLLFRTDDFTNAPGFSISYTSSTIGVDEIGELGTINVFPNPVTSNLTIEFLPAEDGDITIQLFSVSGQNVYSETFPINGPLTKTINTSDFQAGMYYLQCTGGNGFIGKKIMIQK